MQQPKTGWPAIGPDYLMAGRTNASTLSSRAKSKASATPFVHFCCRRSCEYCAAQHKSLSTKSAAWITTSIATHRSDEESYGEWCERRKAFLYGAEDRHAPDRSAREHVLPRRKRRRDLRLRRRRGARAAIDAPLLGKVPLDPRLREQADLGEPLVWAEPENETARTIVELAEAITAAGRAPGTVKKSLPLAT